jgi:hypothetical protein
VEHLSEFSVIELGGLEIDGVRQRVGWGGSTTPLAPREMSAMLALAAEAGDPVPAAELARRIWPGSRMVTAYDVRRIYRPARAASQIGLDRERPRSRLLPDLPAPRRMATAHRVAALTDGGRASRWDTPSGSRRGRTL